MNNSNNESALKVAIKLCKAETSSLNRKRATSKQKITNTIKRLLKVENEQNLNASIYKFNHDIINEEVSLIISLDNEIHEIL